MSKEELEVENIPPEGNEEKKSSNIKRKQKTHPSIYKTPDKNKNHHKGRKHVKSKLRVSKNVFSRVQGEEDGAKIHIASLRP